MKTIYLAGSINGMHDDVCVAWREMVKRELAGLYKFLDPMRRDYRGVETGNVDAIVNGDYEDLSACDLVLADAVNASWGTAMEIHHASKVLGKPVIAVCDNRRPSPWLLKHSLVVPTMGKAISILKGEAK